MQRFHLHLPVVHSKGYGIIIAVICMVLTVVFYATDQYGALWTGFGIALVFFVGILISIIHYNGRHGEKTSTASAFYLGIRTTFLATFLLGIFALIFHVLVVNGTIHRLIPQGFQQTPRIIRGIETEKERFWILFVGNVLIADIAMGVLAAMLGALVFKANQKSAGDATKDNI
ncbi:DUF4199 family protein [Chitinophaga sp. HK235]|uniref:DUF4199 family protein n=1 Tax=Chitinophaga sp. HK235 TaxID=2952571 RepID=UPI001BA55061|nr:DUF4199 family protein [Chitinophaga sp. HK235]